MMSYTWYEPWILGTPALQRALVWTGNDVNLNKYRVIPVGEDFDVEKSELENAYNVMCATMAEYECVEQAASAYSIHREDPGQRVDMRPEHQPPHTGNQPSHYAAVRRNDVINQPYISTQQIRHGNNVTQSSCLSSATVQWLQDNYECEIGISLPRGAMYSHYIDFCLESNIDPVNQASFGKLVRAIFPSVRTRRLGTRGQSKYHYYGLTIKGTSPYKDIMVQAQRVNNVSTVETRDFAGRKMLHTSLPRTSNLTNNSVHTGVLLPGFPTIDKLCIPQEIREKTAILLMMYKHHTQRVVDTILRADFGEVKDILTHFWVSLPSHIRPVLESETVVNMVTLCDSVLYESVGSLLVPGCLHPLPSSLMSAVRNFADSLLQWLGEAMKSQPEALRKKKLEVAEAFGRSLKRQTTISHMASVARTFLHNTEHARKMYMDWREVDVAAITLECRMLLGEESRACMLAIETYLSTFKELLQQRSTIDMYLDWVHQIADTCIFERADRAQQPWLEVARQVLMGWMMCVKVAMRELTIENADTFGSFHLLSMIFTDYLIHLVQERKKQDLERSLKATVYEVENEAAKMDKPLTINDNYHWHGDQITAQASNHQPITGQHSSHVDVHTQIRFDADAFANNKMEGAKNGDVTSLQGPVYINRDCEILDSDFVVYRGHSDRMTDGQCHGVEHMSTDDDHDGLDQSEPYFPPECSDQDDMADTGYTGTYISWLGEPDELAHFNQGTHPSYYVHDDADMKIHQTPHLKPNLA